MVISYCIQNYIIVYKRGLIQHRKIPFILIRIFHLELQINFKMESIVNGIPTSDKTQMTISKSFHTFDSAYSAKFVVVQSLAKWN